jgi:hypothetical protein
MSWCEARAAAIGAEKTATSRLAPAATGWAAAVGVALGESPGVGGGLAPHVQPATNAMSTNASGRRQRIRSATVPSGRNHGS